MRNEQLDEILDQQIIEYNTLKQGMLNYSNNMDSLFMFMFTTVSAIIAFALQQNNPYMLLISFVFLIPAKCRHFFYFKSQLRMSSYIMIFLEPNIKGLNWETRVVFADSVPKNKQPKAFAVSIIQYYSHSIVGLLICILYVIGVMHTNVLLYIIPFPFEIYLIYLDLTFKHQEKRLRKEYDELWKYIKSTMR